MIVNRPFIPARGGWMRIVGAVLGAAVFLVLAGSELSAVKAGPVQTSMADGSDPASGGYGDGLYPYVHEYDLMLVYKIPVDYCPANEMRPLNAAQTLDVIRRIDNLTRGIPKLVYLVGWQYRGHDTGYPALDQVNEHLKRPGDATALDSLRWLMREGPRHHTLVSLHVNFSDCYLDDNALGPFYKERDIIVRSGDGTYLQGYRWCDHLAYRASNFRNWFQGTFRTRQMGPLFAMIPELAASGSLHPDAWYSIDDPYYGVSHVMDCEAMRRMTVYVRKTFNADLTTEFDRRRPAGVDFVLYHPFLWHIAWDERTPPDPMKIPSYILTGTNALTWSSGAETVQSKIFGMSCAFEEEVAADPVVLPGGFKNFATRALAYQFLNRRLRMSFDGQTAVFSGGVTTAYPRKPIVKIGNDVLQDGGDVCFPVPWRTNREAIAYSEKGYARRTWRLPEDWAGVRNADIYRITVDGLVRKPRGASVAADRTVTLSLAADEGVCLVPAGEDPEAEFPAVPSGSVEFLGEDRTTSGSWKGTYGGDGHLVIGAGQKLPDGVRVGFIGGAERTWVPDTRDVQGLEKPDGDTRIIAARASSIHEIIDVEAGALARDVALYVLDADHAGRWTVVDVIDAVTRKRLDSRNVIRFASGVYLKYRIRGRVQLRITNIWTKRYPDSPDAGFSGLFFDPVR